MFCNLAGIEPLKLDKLIEVSSFGDLYLLRIISSVMQPGVFSLFLEHYCDELFAETNGKAEVTKDNQPETKLNMHLLCSCIGKQKSS